MVTINLDGATVSEAIGDYCNKCRPIGDAFAMDGEELASKQDSAELAPKVNEAHDRSSGAIAPIQNKESVNRKDRLLFSGGRHVILLNAKELGKLAGREHYQTMPKYAVEGVPVVSMRTEGNPTVWEDVFVFLDQDRPWRRGFISQDQELGITSKVMNASQHLW